MPEDEPKKGIKIWDRPTENDEFGRSSFVDVIFNTIDTADEAFNLGVSARWGEGKSSILKQLRPKLEGKNYKVLEFQPWKYTQDPISIKRKFLLDICSQLGEKIDEISLYSDQEKEEDLPSDEQSKKLWNYLTQFVAYFIVATIFLAVLIFVLKSLFLPEIDTSKVISEMIIVPALAGLIPFLQKISEIKIKQLIPKIESAEQFETHFNKVIGKLFETEPKPKKAVIFIDDLDRCNPKEVEQVLTALFTFFNNPNCIYIITADHVVIRRYVAEFLYQGVDSGDKKVSDQKKKEHDATEYLKKIFQINFILPKVPFHKLNPWIDKLVSAQNFSFKNQFGEDNLKDLIRVNFERNPRRIKHFIRTLGFQIQIVKEKISDADGTEEENLKEVENYPELLAKILVIQDRFPEFYEEISRSPKLVKAYETGQKTLDDEEIKNFLVQEPKFYNSAFREDSDKDIDPYFFLYISGATGFDEIDMPDPTQIMDFAKNFNVDELLKVFGNLTDKPVFQEIKHLIEELEKSATNDANLLRSLFHLIPIIQKSDTRNPITERLIKSSISRHPTYGDEIPSLQVYDFQSLLKNISTSSLDLIFAENSPYLGVKNQIYQAYTDTQEAVTEEISQYLAKKMAEDINGTQETFNLALPHAKKFPDKALEKLKEFQEIVSTTFVAKEKSIKKDLIAFISSKIGGFDKNLLKPVRDEIGNLIKSQNIDDNLFIIGELASGLDKIIEPRVFADFVCEKIQNNKETEISNFRTFVDAITASDARKILGVEASSQIIKVIVDEVRSKEEAKRFVAAERAQELITAIPANNRKEIINSYFSAISSSGDTQDEQIVNALNGTRGLWENDFSFPKNLKEKLLKIEAETSNTVIKTSITNFIDSFKLRDIKIRGSKYKFTYKEDDK